MNTINTYSANNSSSAKTNLVSSRTNSFGNKKSIISRLAGTDTIQCLSDIFSAIMEERVSPEQTVCLLNVMLALTLAIFPVGISFIVRILLLAYLAVSVYHCKQYME